MEIFYDSYLAHHGIKGQRWGIRRFQNPDGTLTERGKKRVSKEYVKANNKGIKRFNATYTNRYINAHNKSAAEFDTQKFNSDYEKANGSDAFKTQKYLDDYTKEFNKSVAKNFNRSTYEFLKSDPDIQRGKAICDKYNMTSWNDTARKNTEVIEKLRKEFG